MAITVRGRPARPIRVDSGGRIPPGGTTGQALVKSSSKDYATEWGTATASAAWGAISGTLSSQADLQTALNSKQDTLVSGTNIRTINGSTILGPGDLVISASTAWGGITGTLSAQTDLQSALDAKANTSSLAAIATSGSASDLGTGTLPAARFNDTAHGTRAGGTLHANATTSVAGFMSSADKTKLDGVATGATANATDASLRDRSTHTGTQTSSTISDFSEAVDDRVAALVVAGTNMTITYNDVANTLTFAAAGGGGGGAFDYGKSLVTSRNFFLF